MSDKFDLIIIGAGPGGYEAAFEAVKYGMKVAVIEKDLIGGTCLNRGCIPTKTIMHSTNLYRELDNCETLGLTITSKSCSLDKIQDRKTEVLDNLRNGIIQLMKKKKIVVYQGLGKIVSPNTVQVNGETLETENIMISTGSYPFVPPILGADTEGVMTSDDILEKRGEIPKSLIVIGGGAIGLEFATIYNALGTKVTIIEALDRILATMDNEISRSLKMNLTKKGITIHTNAMVKEISRNSEGTLTCSYEEKGEVNIIDAEDILISAGRRSLTKGLFANDMDIALDRGRIIVNDKYQTNYPNIYAVGDVTGGILLAHVSVAEGRNAVAAMNGKSATVDMNAVPGCIYTNPEIASVGMSTADAKKEGIQIVSKKFPMSANGKTVLSNLDRGFIKIIARDDTHEILGAQLMCGRATDMVSELSVAITNHLTLEDIAKTIHPHPTFSEGIIDTVRN